MNYGNLVTIVPDKVRISEKELAPIGIIDKSSCWGRWIPDRWQPGSDNAPPPHLVVSPFPNTSWPALFRLTIILENAAHGTLAKVLDVVDQHALNILSIEGTPAGHRHAVVNIIGEAVDLKLKNDAIKRICDIPDGERLFTNDALSELIHARYAPTMLTYADRLESALIAADEKRDGRFLRETFCRHRSVDGPRGILYDYERLSPEYARLGERQSIPAVKCKWLQNHAFFWAYGSGDTTEKKLTFDAPNSALRPDDVWREEFTEIITQLDPPFKAIASINFEEQFFRLTLSREDRFGNTFRLRLPYTASFNSHSVSTRGALAEICSSLSAGDLSLRSISVSTEKRISTGEKGLYTFLAVHPDSRLTGQKSSEPVREDIETIAEHGAHAVTRKLAGRGCRIAFSDVRVSTFEARKLFVSTTFDWILDTRLGLLDQLRSLAAEFGYVLVMADLDSLGDEHKYMWDGSAPITTNVIKLMRSSDAFLQIIPKSAVTQFTKDGKLNWILFESGSAHALKLPCAISVDMSGGQCLADWIEKLKAGTEKQIFKFNSETDDAQIRQALRKAISYLANEPRPKRDDRFR